MHSKFACLFMTCLSFAAIQAASFNPRVSEDTIALNETVEISFSTTMPLREHVDITSAINEALAVSSVTKHWRVIGKPFIKQYEKAKDVHVRIRLMPRNTGEVRPPSIPIGWLSGDKEVSFKTVTVKRNVKLGTTELAEPKELFQVAGHDWGTSAADFTKATKVAVPAGEQVTVTAAKGLDVTFVNGRLAAARLLSPGLQHSTAKASLMERWGSPESDTDGATVWYVGWVRISASQAADGMQLDLKHEAILYNAMRSKVKKDVFAILEGDGKGNAGSSIIPVIEDQPADDPNSDQTPATEPASKISDDDIKAEMDRQLKQRAEELERKQRR